MTVFDTRSVSLDEVLRVLFKRRGAMLLFFLAAVTGMSLYCFFWPPTYEARRRFLVKVDRDDPIVSPDQNTAIRTVSRVRVLEDDLNSEAAIVKSTPVLLATVQQTNLHHAPVHWLLRWVNAPLESLNHLYNSWHNKPEPDALALTVERLARKTEVQPEKRSAILNVAVRWGDPRVALLLMDKLSANYLEQHLSTHRGPETAQFFQDQADRKRRELASIDRLIASVQPGATLAGVEMERELSVRNSAQAELEWRKAKAAEAEIAARLRASAEQLSNVPGRVVKSERGVVNETAIGALKGRVLDLQIRLADARRKFLPDHRLVKEAEEELAAAQQMLDRELASPLLERTTEMNSLVESLERDRSRSASELQGTAALRGALETDLAQLRSRSAHLKQASVTLASLEREKRWIEESLLIYNKRIEEAKAQDALNRLRVVNVVPLEPPTVGFSPVKPDAPLIFKLGLPLAVLLALGLGFALELLDPSVRSRADLPPGVVVLAAVPPVKRRSA